MNEIQLICSDSTVGVSRDSVVVHEQFERLSPSCGGVNGLSFHLLEDVSGDTSMYHYKMKCRWG